MNFGTLFRPAAALMALSLAWFGSASAQQAPAPQGLEVMALEAGVWDADITFPSNEPGKPDGKAKGTQINTLHSGGRWMLNQFSVEGTNYEGTGLWGYDRATGRFSGIWTDNNDQHIRLDDGRWDPATRTMTWTANTALPDGRYVRMLATSEFKDDTRIFSSYVLTRKGEVPTVKIVFKRRPGVAPAKAR